MNRAPQFQEGGKIYQCGTAPLITVDERDRFCPAGGCRPFAAMFLITR